MTSTSDRIVDELLERVARGDLGPGQTAPTEGDVAREWSVSHRHATEAVRQMVVRGVFHLGRPGGYVVAPRAGDAPLLWRSQDGPTPGYETTEIIATGTLPVLDVDPWVAGAVGMGRTRGHGLFRQRVLRRHGVPRCVVTSWFAITVLSTQSGWQDVERKLLSREPVSGGTPALIGELVGEGPVREDRVVLAVQGSQEEIELLGLDPGSTVLRVATTTSSMSWPLECTVRVYPPDTPCVPEVGEPRH